MADDDEHKHQFRALGRRVDDLPAIWRTVIGWLIPIFGGLIITLGSMFGNNLSNRVDQQAKQIQELGAEQGKQIQALSSQVASIATAINADDKASERQDQTVRQAISELRAELADTRREVRENTAAQSEISRELIDRLHALAVRLEQRN